MVKSHSKLVQLQNSHVPTQEEQKEVFAHSIGHKHDALFAFAGHNSSLDHA